MDSIKLGERKLDDRQYADVGKYLTGPDYNGNQIIVVDGLPMSVGPDGRAALDIFWKVVELIEQNELAASESEISVETSNHVMTDSEYAALGRYLTGPLYEGDPVISIHGLCIPIGPNGRGLVDMVKKPELI